MSIWFWRQKKMMKNRLVIVLICIGLLVLGNSIQVLASTTPGTIETGTVDISYRNVTVYAPAVAQTNSGYIGVISTITITIQNGGSGRVFVDTVPLAQLDMQGSARLAVDVASALVRQNQSCNINPEEYDYFFVIRTEAPVIGGPSAGAIMTTGLVSLLMNWTMAEDTVMTGMINPDGSIGPIGGIPYKVDAAASVGANRVLIPDGQMLYTEVITETTGEGWWSEIITKTVTRNVSEYAWDNYQIDVVEVSDVNDALEYYTGNRFNSGEINGSVFSEQYNEVMLPLAEGLLENASSAVENATLAYENTDIPNVFPNYYENQVGDLLQGAEESLIESETWFEEGFFYSSTSKSFQCLINANFVSYACEFFENDQDSSYVEELIDSATTYYEKQDETAKNAEILGMVSLQCVGAAQKRASEVKVYLTDAISYTNQGEWLSALYNVAYANQRAQSVGWWLNISSGFNDTGDIDDEDIEDLATRYVEESQQAVIYAQLILDELGESSSYLTEASALLSAAQNDLDSGYYAASLFEALEALARGNLALELVSGSTTERLERYEEAAALGIIESRSLGIEPVLAMSYYEYGMGLKNASEFESAMVYFRYSDMITGVLSLSNVCSTSGSSRYVGIPELPVGTSGAFFEIVEMISYVIVFGVFTGLVGLALGFVIGSLMKDTKKPTQKQTPLRPSQVIPPQQSTNQYQKDESAPKSLDDYFK